MDGNVDRVDMFEIEVVENIPLTKVSFALSPINGVSKRATIFQVSRGNRVKKKKMIKIKDFFRDNVKKGVDKQGRKWDVTDWTKIEVVIPTGMKYR